MYKLDYNISININLSNGIYTFFPMSGIGKSRLYSTIRSYMADPKLNAYAVTYADLQRGENVDIEIDKRNPKLIIFDRYNLYKGQFLDTIKKYMNDAIILIDYKGIQDILNGLPDEQCYIDMTEDNIEVTL